MKKILFVLPLLAFSAALPVASAASKSNKALSPETAHDFKKLFNNKLVDGAGKRVSSDGIGKAKYKLVYFSAHWCPPCRAFTPKLVEFTNANRKDGNFDVVLVSSDQNVEKMKGYISETKMPWGGVLSKEAGIKDIGAGITGIPALRLFDADGKLIADTYVDGKYVGPSVVLEALKKKLK